MAGVTRPRGDGPIPTLHPEEAPADEETVEDSIGETVVVPEEETGFEEEVLPLVAAEREGLDWYTPEQFEEDQEGIGPPLEEALHEVDQLHEAILDEGLPLEGWTGNETREAVEEEEDEELKTRG